MEIKMLLPTTTPIPPISPSANAAAAPMIYVKRDPAWEYKRIVRDQNGAQLLTETELNDLGKDGWELTGIIAAESIVNFYLKRLID